MDKRGSELARGKIANRTFHLGGDTLQTGSRPEPKAVGARELLSRHVQL